MMTEQRACATDNAHPARINAQNLEEVSLELSRLEELLAALELVTDSLARGDTVHERMSHDATIGVVSAVQRQAQEARMALDGLFRIERDARLAA